MCGVNNTQQATGTEKYPDLFKKKQKNNLI